MSRIRCTPPLRDGLERGHGATVLDPLVCFSRCDVIEQVPSESGILGLALESPRVQHRSNGCVFRRDAEDVESKGGILRPLRMCHRVGMRCRLSGSVGAGVVDATCLLMQVLEPLNASIDAVPLRSRSPFSRRLRNGPGRHDKRGMIPSTPPLSSRPPQVVVATERTVNCCLCANLYQSTLIERVRNSVMPLGAPSCD